MPIAASPVVRNGAPSGRYICYRLCRDFGRCIRMLGISRDTLRNKPRLSNQTSIGFLAIIESFRVQSLRQLEAERISTDLGLRKRPGDRISAGCGSIATGNPSKLFSHSFRSTTAFPPLQNGSSSAITFPRRFLILALLKRGAS